MCHWTILSLCYYCNYMCYILLCTYSAVGDCNGIRWTAVWLKLDNLDKMENFLERYKLLKWSKEETEYLKRPIVSEEIELVIKNKQTKLPTKRPDPEVYINEFYQTFEK